MCNNTSMTPQPASQPASRTVALVPRLTDGGTTLSYLLTLMPVRCSAVSAAATCMHTQQQTGSMQVLRQLMLQGASEPS